jgi:hypothetical protein
MRDITKERPSTPINQRRAHEPHYWAFSEVRVDRLLVPRPSCCRVTMVGAAAAFFGVFRITFCATPRVGRFDGDSILGVCCTVFLMAFGVGVFV